MNKYNILNGEKDNKNVLEIKTKNDIIYPYSAFFIKPESEEEKKTRLENGLIGNWYDITDKPKLEEKIEGKSFQTAYITPLEVQDININFGENTLKFKENGEIYLNDRLLTTDGEIVTALRKFLQLGGK